MISDQSPGASGVRSHADGAAAEPIADAELRLIRILQHRGRIVARAFDGAPTIQRLLDAGLVRAVERPGADVILVLSGDGLRLARAH
jgi:hypothetical protein